MDSKNHSSSESPLSAALSNMAKEVNEEKVWLRLAIFCFGQSAVVGDDANPHPLASMQGVLPVF